MVELVGYLGSVFVVTSLLMTRILRLRTISLLGSITFLIYAVLIGSIPIAITNVVLMVINITFLIRATRATEWFFLLEVRPESLYLAEFLRFYGDDIAGRHPDWDGEIQSEDVTALVLRDMQPAMALVARPEGDEMHVRLDYGAPRFRDYRMGRFLYGSNLDFFTEKGFSRVSVEPVSDHQRQYLSKMGFSETDPGRYELALV